MEYTSKIKINVKKPVWHNTDSNSYYWAGRMSSTDQGDLRYWFMFYVSNWTVIKMKYS